MQELNSRIASVDRKFPPPSAPRDEPPLHRVRSVDANATITLEGGEKITMKGVTCQPPGAANVKRFLGTREEFVAFIVPPKPGDQPVAADFWIVEHEEIDGHPTTQYMVLAEVALMSGWCESVPRESLDFEPRYRALEEAFGAKTKK